MRACAKTVSTPPYLLQVKPKIHSLEFRVGKFQSVSRNRDPWIFSSKLTLRSVALYMLCRLKSRTLLIYSLTIVCVHLLCFSEDAAKEKQYQMSNILSYRRRHNLKKNVSLNERKYQKSEIEKWIVHLKTIYLDEEKKTKINDLCASLWHIQLEAAPNEIDSEKKKPFSI